jgi:hypothetical protein
MRFPHDDWWALPALETVTTSSALPGKSNNLLRALRAVVAASLHVGFGNSAEASGDSLAKRIGRDPENKRGSAPEKQ